MKPRQDLFPFARMTPAEYLDDLQQMRIPEVVKLEAKIQTERNERYTRGSLEDSD